MEVGTHSECDDGLLTPTQMVFSKAVSITGELANYSTALSGIHVKMSGGGLGRSVA